MSPSSREATLSHRVTALPFLLSAALVLGAASRTSARAAELCGPPGPEVVFLVDVGKPAGGTVRLQWLSQFGHYSDVVRGSLSTLAASAGDFGLALEGCVLEDLNVSGTGAFEDADIPPVGDGYWYLIRADRYEGCGTGIGTYNSVSRAHQLGDRNPEILSSGRDCACYLGDCTVWYP